MGKRIGIGREGTIYGEGAVGCEPWSYPRAKRRFGMLAALALVVIVLLLVGALPTWPYSRGWGYYPSGGLGLVLIILLILVLLGRF